MSESTAQRPLTGRKLKEALQKGYSDARGEVLLPLIKLLRTHLLDVWVPVADLFGEEMLPEKITKRSFSRAFWEKADEEHEGVRVYKSGDDDRYILLRYKHSEDSQTCSKSRKGEEKEVAKRERCPRPFFALPSMRAGFQRSKQLGGSHVRPGERGAGAGLRAL